MIFGDEPQNDADEKSFKDPKKPFRHGGVRKRWLPSENRIGSADTSLKATLLYCLAVFLNIPTVCFVYDLVWGAPQRVTPEPLLIAFLVLVGVIGGVWAISTSTMLRVFVTVWLSLTTLMVAAMLLLAVLFSGMHEWTIGL